MVNKKQQSAWHHRVQGDTTRPLDGAQVDFYLFGDRQMFTGQVVRGHKLWISIDNEIRGDENNVERWRYATITDG